MDWRNQTSVQQERLTPIIAYGEITNRTLVNGPNTASLAQPARSTSMHEVPNPTASNSNNPVSAVPTPIPPLPKTLLHSLRPKSSYKRSRGGVLWDTSSMTK
ncbi:unnamed protein product [Rodentolepis nana]|uniref:Uncharacterized protein n=1 Tax=Rodentolepis nana TaxID=102285 RepID=A0A0R3TFH8_RODNA|nr:unnamed protein product [Rodentolepis nana]